MREKKIEPRRQVQIIAGWRDNQRHLNRKHSVATDGTRTGHGRGRSFCWAEGNAIRSPNSENPSCPPSVFTPCFIRGSTASFRPNPSVRYLCSPRAAENRHRGTVIRLKRAGYSHAPENNPGFLLEAQSGGRRRTSDKLRRGQQESRPEIEKVRLPVDQKLLHHSGIQLKCSVSELPDQSYQQHENGSRKQRWLSEIEMLA